MNDDTDRKRTLNQNAKMWPMLSDFAKQIKWPHTRGTQWVIELMKPQAWKAVMTAAFEQELEQAQGLNGGNVMIGASTSNYGLRKFAEFIEFLYSAGQERGVVWSEKSNRNFAELRPKGNA